MPAAQLLHRKIHGVFVVLNWLGVELMLLPLLLGPLRVVLSFFLTLYCTYVCNYYKEVLMMLSRQAVEITL